MRRPRHAIVVLLVLGLLGFAVPALALAAGGGCASCQQYTDPFGGSGGQTTTHRTTPGATPSPPSNAPAPSTPVAAPATSSVPTGTAAPTAPAASTAAPASTAATATLPFTGYDGGLAALLGGGLVLAGAALRIGSRRP